jgi:hypothetical protein
MSTEMTSCYKYLIRPMGFSLRQANLFMCKARAISRGRRAAGYWNNIQGLEVRLSAQKLPARLAGTLCYYLASNLFAAAKRAPWAEHHQSCYSFIIKYTHLPDDPFGFYPVCFIVYYLTGVS